MPKVDMIGKKFNRWTVLKDDGFTEGKNKRYYRYLCVCDCGTVRSVIGRSLRKGITKSCGCLQKERAAAAQVKHGHASRGGTTRTYYTWTGMIARCTQPHHGHYKYYGARGIKVCDRWLNSFENFLADMGERPAGRTIDRKNNDGNYEPSNCRWATPKEQVRNQRKRGTALLAREAQARGQAA